MFKKKTIAIIAATAAFGLLGATAASAVTVNDVEWGITTGRWGVDSAQGGAVGAYGFDQFNLAVSPVGADNYSGLNCATLGTEVTDAANNVTVACDEPNADVDADPSITRTNLKWSGDVKVYSTDGDIAGRIARVTYNLTNDTASDISADLRLTYDNEECNNSGAAGTTGTSDGDTDAEVTDTWATCNNDNDALEGIVWGDNLFTSVDFDGASPSSYGLMNLYKDAYVVPACSTRTFVFYAYSTGARDHGSSAGSTDADFNTYITSSFSTSNPGHGLFALLDGVDHADNWTGLETPAGSGCSSSNGGAKKTLANTGSTTSDALAMLGLAVLGAGVAAIRRARSAR